MGNSNHETVTKDCIDCQIMVYGRVSYFIGYSVWRIEHTRTTFHERLNVQNGSLPKACRDSWAGLPYSCGSPLYLPPPGGLRLPISKHVGILT